MHSVKKDKNKALKSISSIYTYIYQNMFKKRINYYKYCKKKEIDLIYTSLIVDLSFFAKLFLLRNYPL